MPQFMSYREATTALLGEVLPNADKPFACFPDEPCLCADQRSITHDHADGHRKILEDHLPRVR